VSNIFFIVIAFYQNSGKWANSVKWQFEIIFSTSNFRLLFS